MSRYLGQHFLVDEQILRWIVDAIQQMVDDFGSEDMWEIGPGQWALTKEIYRMVSRFLCFEKDEKMKKYLGQFLQEEQIVRGDILEENTESRIQNTDIDKVLIVWNLPYYITSPICRKFFAEALRPRWWVFLIQKEVAEKIRTDARKKSYLRWLLNNGYEIEYLFTVPPTSFDPPPKVDSAVIRLKREKMKKLKDEEYEKMLKLLDIISQYKRKTLGKIWKMRKADLLEFDLPEGLEGKRLEELGWEEMKKILMW